MKRETPQQRDAADRAVADEIRKAGDALQRAMLKAEQRDLGVRYSITSMSRDFGSLYVYRNFKTGRQTPVLEYRWPVLELPVLPPRWKVYGGSSHVNGKQVRCFVAAPSQKEAARLAGVSLSHVRDYWADTSNEREVETASAKPGAVFYWSDVTGSRFNEVPQQLPAKESAA